MWTAVFYAFVPVFATASAFFSAALKSLRCLLPSALVSDKADPATGLNGREKRLVKKSWTLASRDAQSTGIGLFLALFEAHPEYQKLFTSFSDLRADELTSNKFFVNHAMTVTNSVGLIVDSLNDAPALVALLKRFAASHGRRGITEKHFLNVAVVLVDFLEAALGKRKFDETTRKSWLHVLQVAVAVIKPELEC